MTGSSEQRTVLSIIGVNPDKIGGLEAYARELSLQLGERGWRSILCFQSPPPAVVRDYLILDNVVLEYLEGAISGAMYQLKLVCLIIRYRPAVLHLQLVQIFGPYAWVARLFGARGVFYTDQVSRPTGFVGEERPVWKQIFFRGMMKPLTRIFCISQYVRQSFISLGLLPDERLTVLYNSVDIERAEAGMGKAEEFRMSLGISADTFLVVQVGQIIPEKGVPDLLEAAARVCLVNSAVHFLFVGDGEYLTEYRKLADRLGITDKVTFTGPIADPLAIGVFAAADLVCQVSRWEEAFGLVIAEAMAVARPVLATRAGGIPELVTNGVTGYTVERDDIEAIVTHILDLSRQQEWCVSLGAAGQKVCREKFDLRKNVNLLLNYYGID